MAINPIEVPCDKTAILSHGSLNHYKHGKSLAGRLVKTDFAPDGSLSSLATKTGKYKNNLEPKSPYLKDVNHPILGDSVRFLSRVTEKRIVHKNGGNVLMSSFPLAGNIYKANSDDLKGKQVNKKVLKSVLTLPNNSAPITQLCTVNDMKDSEYFNATDELRKMNKHRKSQAMRKCRPNFKDYKRETQYCSDMDFNMDSSSTDTIKKCGDGKRTHKSTAESKGKYANENVKPHNVWALLRNMNRFQFQTSPPLSENEYIISKQKISPKRRNNRKDLRVFETRRTEEFAYISRYDVDKSPSLSLCSSFGKITVIDKNQDSKLFRDIEDKPKKKKPGKHLVPRAIKNSIKTKTLSAKQNDLKAVTYHNHKKNWNTDSTGKWQISSFSPNNGDQKAVLNKKASVDLGYESKTTENDEDFLSFDKNTATQASQSSESKLSDNSGSSKAAVFPNPVIHKTAKFKPKVEPCKQVNGITKVILCRGQNMKQSQEDKNEALKTNIHHGTDKYSCPGGLPKLTKTEISRQLHKYRFPVVILGKSQLRSSIHVVNSENPQFDGLDQQIWPFMKNWYGIEKPVKVIKRVNHNIHTKKTKLDDIEKKAPLKNNVPKSTKIVEKIPKIEPKRAPLPLSDILNQTTQNQRKLKPIRQLKDRVLKLLYKNSIAGMIDGSPESDTGKSNNMSVNVCTDTQDRSESSNSTANANKCVIPKSIEKRPWAKAKWASDFIENVIEKVKSGAYYNQNIIDKVCNESFVIEKKEEDVQTDSTTDEVTFTSNFSPQAFNANDDEPKQQIAIPGFDSVLPALEIKIMSINEVAVKHCGTNIMVHFDVTIPTNSIVAVKNDSSLIPLNMTKSLTKVFKCKTSILNAMLPAELCSILPKMVRDIVSGQHLALYTAPIDMTCLTTISELPIPSESLSNIPTSTLTIPAILPINPLPPKLQQVLNVGFFKKDVSKTAKPNVLRSIPSLINYETRSAKELRHYIERIHMFEIENQLMMPVKATNPEEPKMLPITTIKPTEQLNTITALQPYSVTNHRSISMSRSLKLMNLFETMATYINNIGLSCFRIKADKTNSNFSINMNMGNFISAPNIATLRIDYLKIDPFNDCSKNLTSSKISVLPDTDKALVAYPRSIDDVKLSAPKENTMNSTHSLNNKVRRKSYVKLCRKCKSSFNVFGEKVTPLDKISNLEDFFQALGSAKVLSGVFDGQSGKKIMSSIKELKNWTTEINPEQALLVILLANKKEFPNLLRYRPMLLQGIALKRITKAIELDMEIEVIEVENLGVSRYEGISYLPASIENQGSLYDELCWIAKNTASDYQRPFDHNSEKLLKSLLGKRKQLNPSYLRVMARYVGLGLLKSPNRRQ